MICHGIVTDFPTRKTFLILSNFQYGTFNLRVHAFLIKCEFCANGLCAVLLQPLSPGNVTQLFSMFTEQLLRTWPPLGLRAHHSDQEGQKEAGW